MTPPITDSKSPRLTRRETLRAAGAGAATLFGGGLLAACGSSSSSSGGGSGGAGLTKVTDQLGWLKTSQFCGYYAAIEHGYYKKEGIDDVLLAGGPNIIASTIVGAGKAMVGDDDNNTVLQAIAKGQPLVIYGSIYQRSPYAVFSLPDKPIRTLQDFAGKKVALSPATRPLLDPLLQKAGVDIGSIHFVPVGGNPAQLANHQVDGYFGFTTNEGVALKQRGVDFVTTMTYQLGLKSYGNVLITRRDTLQKNKDLLVRHLRATIRGWEYADAHPQEMGQLTVKKYGPPGSKLDEETGQAQAQVALINNPQGIMRITEQGMQEVIDGMVAAKALAKPLKASDVMTTEILDAVYGNKTSI